MSSTTRQTTPAPPEVVSRVEDELRGGWWSTTLLMSVPVVVAVLLGYVVTLSVRGGDWLALLFPGIVVMASTWLAWRVLSRAIGVKRAEARMSEPERNQAVYVRGLSGTHRLAAGQDAEAFAVLDPIWRSWQGRVTEVRLVRTRRSREGLLDLAQVDVRDRSGAVTTALLTAPRHRLPGPGTRVSVLADPHHPRAVVDLRTTPSDRGPRGGKGSSR